MDVVDEYHSEEYWQQFWDNTNAIMAGTDKSDASYVWDRDKQEFISVSEADVRERNLKGE